MKPRLRISVAKRLALLAVAESATISILAVVILISLRQIEENIAFTRRFGLPPIELIGKVLVQNGHILDTARHQLSSGDTLDPATVDEHLRTLHALESRYRLEWLIKANPSADALKARAVLEPAGRTDLIDDEKTAFDDFIDAARRLEAATHLEPPDRTTEMARDLRDIQSSLRVLRNVATGQVIVAQRAVEEEVEQVRSLVLLVAAAGVIAAAWAALHVRRAIAPRIRQLVHKVRRFSEVGVNERVFDAGWDEIGILANAIDAGFTAIMERDREREKFLAVVAHELKTPLSSILGFAQAANQRPDNVELGRRALELVERHGLRLSRLLEDVLLAARARAGDLPIHREPMDLGAGVRKVVAEVQAAAPTREIAIDTPLSAPILADEGLLLHSLWTFITYGVAISAGLPLRISIVHEPPHCEVRLDVHGRDLSEDEFSRALAPFGALVYEGIGGARTGIGLFLCREIARVHGGALRIERTASGIRLVLELPA